MSCSRAGFTAVIQNPGGGCETRKNCINFTPLFPASPGKQACLRPREERLLGRVSEVLFATEMTRHFKLKLGLGRNWFSNCRHMDELTKLSVSTSGVLICRL